MILRGTVTALTLPRQVHGLHSPVLMLVTGSTPQWMALSPSQRLVVDGRLAPPQPGDDITAVLTARGPPQLVGRPSAVQRVAGSIRSGLRSAVSGQSADVRGLLPGLVLGDVSRMDPTLTDDFRTAGLTHLVAVSGANVAILFAVVLALTRLVRVPPRAAMVGSAVVLVGFVVLVRPTPSVLRAAAMAGLLVTAALTGRLRQPLSALLGAVLLLVLVDPELSRSAGFALSTVATAALLVVAPRWAVVLRRHMPRRVADSLAVATAAQLACGPVDSRALGPGQPGVRAGQPAGRAGGSVRHRAGSAGCASLHPVAMPLARVCAEVAALPTLWLVVVARHAAHAPYATVAWQQSAAGGVALALLTVGVVVAARHRASRRVLCAGAAGLLVAVLGLRLTAGPWASHGWAFVACDVGQGDGLVLNAGSAAVVVDAGPDPVKMKSCLDRLGVRHVAMVVLSHLHADHVEGLPGVFDGRQVDALDVGPLSEPVGESHRVLAWAAAAHVPVQHLVAGDVFNVGDLTASVIAPLTVLHGTDSDPNNDSLVLRVVLPTVSLLLTGDMEQVAQQQLLASGARLDADVRQGAASRLTQPGLRAAGRDRSLRRDHVGRRGQHLRPSRPRDDGSRLRRRHARLPHGPGRGGRGRHRSREPLRSRATTVRARPVQVSRHRNHPQRRVAHSLSFVVAAGPVDRRSPDELRVIRAADGPWTGRSRQSGTVTAVRSDRRMPATCAVSAGGCAGSVFLGDPLVR